MIKPRFNEVIVVEGKYDAAKLNSLVDALVITTDGFSVFSKNDTKEMIKRLGTERGLIILTDSDAAGFKIRNYINNFAKGVSIKNAYIPSIKGKESRKAHGGKEGLLGVEGVSAEIIIKALKDAGAVEAEKRKDKSITHTDLYNLGLSGSGECACRREAFLKSLGLPVRLSKNAMCEVLSALYSYDELVSACEKAEKPALFWDFHGTLTQPDGIWYSAALKLLGDIMPEHGLNTDVVRNAFYISEMPWWKTEKSDKCLCGSAWWDFHENELCKIYQSCGVEKSIAEKASKGLRLIIMDKETHRLYGDAVNVLSELSKRGYRQFLLSSNFPCLSKLAEDMEIAVYFEKIISSADIGCDKPSVLFYNTALKMCQIKPQNAVMIGDNPENDIKPAIAVGMRAFAVNRGHEAPLATWKSESLNGVLEVFK